jgi:3-hydroxyisobutyrate dehydrogenase
METTQQVGVLGLGAMGSGMAAALMRAGFTVRGYDINSTALTTFTEAGGIAASTPAEAADGVEALVVMVLNSDQAEQAIFGSAGAISTLRPGTVLLLCSTTAPGFVRNLAQRLSAHGVYFLDAPVSGGVKRAAEGTLSVMAAGNPGAYRAAEAVLDAIADNVFHMGDEPGQGATMKLVNQILAGIHIAAAAEAVAFGARAGIDPNRIYEVITHSAGASWMFNDRVPHILADDFTPHSAVDIWLKDLNLILETGRDLRLPMPLAAVAHQLFLMAAASGYGRLDDAAVIKVFEKLADFRVLDTPGSDADA